jgi:hypothetical protein
MGVNKGFVYNRIELAEREGFYARPDSNRLTLILKEHSAPA